MKIQNVAGANHDMIPLKDCTMKIVTQNKKPKVKVKLLST